MEPSLVIDAAPEAVFEETDDFRAWAKWSPGADADREVSFDGADCEEGLTQLEAVVEGDEEN